MSMRFTLLALLSLACAASGHQIPSVQLELEITSGGPHTLRLNVDPRLVISQTPASVPPLPASWYLDQSTEQVAETHEKTIRYISEMFRFDYGTTTAPSDWTVQPIDGLTNEALSSTTSEVHLLASCIRTPTSGIESLKIGLANEAAAALTIITLIDGKPSRRAQVLFPGETSKPITWTAPQNSPSTEASAQANEPFRWYAEPIKLVQDHVFRLHWLSHACFILLLGICIGKSTLALVGLGWFHLCHLTAAFLCGINQTVLTLPSWLWLAGLVGLLAPPFMPSYRALVAAVALALAATLHVLNHWPTSAEPRIIALMEAVLLGSHLALLIPVLLLHGLWKTKKAVG
jgi:hypothetical protein